MKNIPITLYIERNDIMSLTSTMDYLKESRAKFARDVEYVKEISHDDVIDECVESAEFLFEPETTEELQEAVDMVERLSDEENLVESADELSRILEADGDISFNEMIGLE